MGSIFARPEDGLPLRLCRSGAGRTKMDALFDEIEPIPRAIFAALDEINTDLVFWSSLEQKSQAAKLRFVLLGRGPLCCVQGLSCMARSWISEDPMPNFAEIAACWIEQQVRELTLLQRRLATCLGEIYYAVDGLADEDYTREDVTVALRDVYDGLKQLEYGLNQLEWNYKLPVMADSKLLVIPNATLNKPEWTNQEMTAAACCLRTKLNAVNNSVARMTRIYQRPGTISRCWVRYCASAACATMVLWSIGISKVATAVKTFFRNHVQAPVTDARKALAIQEDQSSAEHLQLSAESLNRVFDRFAPGGKEQLDRSYENQLESPMKNLFAGDLGRILVIYVQKLKYDLERVLFEASRILNMNRLNLALLAALPAIAAVGCCRKLFRALVPRRPCSRSELALLAEAEKAIMQWFKSEGQSQEYGVVLSIMDKMYRSSPRSASSLREELVNIANPRVGLVYRLLATSRLRLLYESVDRR